MKRRTVFVLAGAVLGAGERAGAAIVYDVPAGNTGPMNNDIRWNSVGAFGGGAGVVIAPNYFITVDHVGGESPGGPFSLVTTINNVTTTTSYTTTAATGIAGTDLIIFKVNGTFPTASIAPLYTGAATEVGASGAAISFVGEGYSTQGTAIVTGGVTNGWFWSGSQAKNFAQNTIAAVSSNDSLGGAEAFLYQFQPITGANEGIYSSGDSGGGDFILNGGQFQLAGINDYISPPYYQETSPGVYTLLSDGHAGSGQFDAAIFNGANLYVEVATNDFQPADANGFEYEIGVASDLQEYLTQIQSAIPEPSGAVILPGLLLPLALRRRSRRFCQRGS